MPQAWQGPTSGCEHHTSPVSVSSTEQWLPLAASGTLLAALGCSPEKSCGCPVLTHPWCEPLGQEGVRKAGGVKGFCCLFPSVGSTSSSPALLGIREPRSEYDRTHPSMQYYSSQGDVIAHKDIYTGKRPAGDRPEQRPAPCGRSSQSDTANCISRLVAANCFSPFPLVFPGCGTGQGSTWLCCKTAQYHSKHRSLSILESERQLEFLLLFKILVQKLYDFVHYIVVVML